MIVKKDILAFHREDRVLLRANDFIYLLPHPTLRNWISNYTITFPNKSIISDRYTVIPHGSATLVFSCDRNGIYGNLFGPATKPTMVGDHANQFDMLLIIEFQPAGLYPFTGVMQKELADLTFPFEMINNLLNASVHNMLITSLTVYELITSLDKLLWSNLHPTYPSQLHLATHMIIEQFGNVSQKELSDATYYSERHLNRIFDQYLGMNTKTFARMVRINKAIRLLQNPQSNIAWVSDAAGFYDSPHFIHDFKSVCGITPQEYRNNMSDFYSEIAKF